MSIPKSFIDFITNELTKPLTTRKILSNRKMNFIYEYLKLNNISISSSCSVKTHYEYKFGHLTLINSKLTIIQYE